MQGKYMMASRPVKHLTSLDKKHFTWRKPDIWHTQNYSFAEASKEVLGWLLPRIKMFPLTKGNVVTVALQEIFAPCKKVNISLFSTETAIISQSTTVAFSILSGPQT